MAKQRKHCEASIARVYSEHLRVAPYIHPSPPVCLDTRFVSNNSSKPYRGENDEVSKILQDIFMVAYNGLELELTAWSVHTRATIAGLGFSSGMPTAGVLRKGGKMRRCSSVITLVRGGRSIYGWVIRFLSFDRIHAAHVEWFPVPEYPLGSPVFCRIDLDNPRPPAPCVVSLMDIDPSRIMMLQEDACLYVVRMNGINTMSRVRNI